MQDIVPPFAFQGTVTLTITTSDLGASGSGGALTDSDTVLVEVTSENHSPWVSDEIYHLPADEEFEVAAPGVLVNAADADGDQLTAQLLDGPSHGELTLNPDGSFSYLPDDEFVGTDSFTVQAYDGSLTSQVFTVSLVVYDPEDDECQSTLTIDTTVPNSAVLIFTDACDVENRLTIDVVGTGGASRFRFVDGAGHGIELPDPLPEGWTVVDGWPEVPVAGIGVIRVFAKGGNDLIDCGNLSVIVEIFGGLGDDVLVGGGGNDVIIGGDT